MTYVELHAKSAFSFLEAAALPEVLAERAAALGQRALALVDADGVYGAPRFYRACTRLGITPLVGAEISMRDGGRLPLLIEDREGYRNLCRLLTRIKMRAAKGEGAAGWDDLEEHVGGLVCLTGGPQGPVAHRLERDGHEAARATLDRLTGLFGRFNVFAELQRDLDRESEAQNEWLRAEAGHRKLALLASNAPVMAERGERPLLDTLTCIRHGTTIAEAGRLLARNSERFLRPPSEMERLFADCPAAVANTGELALRLVFTMKDIGYRFPDYPLPPGQTPMGFLRALCERGAKDRYGAGPLALKARRQIEHELELIGRLDLPGYFLIVWDLIEYCRHHDILVQGRGSAANSAVCYALGITAVDPVGMKLLFERFLSEERGEWPDIDLDLPSGDRREQVIQYVYQRYGRLGAAMTANVITYRGRSAAREVGKTLGLPPALCDRLSGLVSDWEYKDPGDSLLVHLREAGCDPESPMMRHFAHLWTGIQDLPRHLGQHSGGMVVCAGRLDGVVPLEPASMPDRSVVQWDKDDCAAMGIIKVDLLGLGMMALLEDALEMIRRRGGHVDLAHLPTDPAVYAMLKRADTIGVFQVESRAQMATLPRLKPECFYDLVVQVAIIRPGPIVGDMVHPYLRRRAGRERITVPHPVLEPILERTLGVPLFQEQLLRMAMAAAGFTGGEAEELRRAFGFKRRKQAMEEVEKKLRAGMTAKGITGEAAEAIIRSITSFALYGFPECVVGETRVVDADTGRLVRIDDVVKGHEPIRHTLACDTNMKIRKRRVLKATSSGRRLVYRVRTVSGRTITATAEHPLLTLAGWRLLHDLHPGDHIAAIRTLPPLGGRRWFRHWLIVLAGLIAEGNLCHPSTPYFYTTDSQYCDEFVKAVEKFPNTRATVARHRSCYSVHVRRCDRARAAGVVEWLKELGLWGLDSRGKHVPDAVFGLQTGDVGLFLARLWEGDGSFSRAGHVSYDTVSSRLAEDVRHLLLRLGITARLYTRIRPYRDRQVTGFVVTVTGQENLRLFYKSIARRFLVRRKCELVKQIAGRAAADRSSRDVIPVEIKTVIDGARQQGSVTWESVAKATGLSMRADKLKCLAESDLYWDRIVAIDRIGVRETYDLSVEGDHNFVANDLVVHNSHAASFALLAYASAYLKTHHPAAFYAALLNNQPMGFYHPATIVGDAARHGQVIRPLDVNHSDWLCIIEADGTVRLGLRYVRGLREEVGRRMECARPFASADDLVRRAGLRSDELARLAELGALGSLGLERRAALWEVERAARRAGPLYNALDPPPEPSPLLPMTPTEAMVADYEGSGLSLGPHPMTFHRARLERSGVVRATDLQEMRDGGPVRVAGAVVVRQRPGTAKGFVFLNLEDETGLVNVVVPPPLFNRYRLTLVDEPFLLITGVLEHREGVISVRAGRIEPLRHRLQQVPSHDFH